MGAEAGQSKAPTAVIETLIVVRPIKVVALLCGVLAVLILLLSVAATAWIKADGTREGLWEKCDYNKTVAEWVHCSLNRQPDWIVACQALCLISMILSVIAIICTTKGLKTDNFKYKYKLYWAGLVIFFLAAGFEIMSLVVFPVKFLDDDPNSEQIHWNFGWSYIVGWLGAITEFSAGMFLLLDRGAEEVIYRERVVQPEDEKEATDDSQDV